MKTILVTIAVIIVFGFVLCVSVIDVWSRNVPVSMNNGYQG